MTSYLVLPAPNVVKRILDRAVKDEWVSTYGRDDKTLYHLEEEGYNRLRSEIYAWQRTVKVWEKEDKSR